MYYTLTVKHNFDGFLEGAEKLQWSENITMTRLLFLCFIILALFGNTTAQTSTYNGWFVFNYDHKLSNKFSFISDVQVRSANNWNYVKTLLVRPALQYNFSKARSTALGCAYFAHWNRDNVAKTFEAEHRIWEQYNIKLAPGSTEMTHRLRLEQRFIGKGTDYDFAQRLRYYLRTQIPFVRTKEFTKGSFVALQNEIFLNVQNKENVNNHFFDQNRTYAALGNRFSKKN